MKRKPLIAGNWKMHKTIGEASAFFHDLFPKIEKANCHIFIAPPYIAIAKCAELVEGKNIRIGGQNMCEEEEGPFTGEISVKMLKDAGASFVILGHSERRCHFHESNQRINKKLKQAINNNFPIILCVGETEEQYEAGDSKKVVAEQLDECLKGLKKEELNDLMIAYEPVWAIGTGKTATPSIAQEIHKVVRRHIAKNLDARLAENMYMLYGGSVKPQNAADLLFQPDIDGALIGGASLKAQDFAAIIQQVSVS